MPEQLINLIMPLYQSPKSEVKVAGVLTEKFPIGDGVHQGSVMSPILFIILIKEAKKEYRNVDTWELLCADDLMIRAESKDEVIENFKKWQDGMTYRGQNIDVGKKTSDKKKGAQ